MTSHQRRSRRNKRLAAEQAAKDAVLSNQRALASERYHRSLSVPAVPVAHGGKPQHG